jgi:hypothetical protein
MPTITVSVNTAAVLPQEFNNTVLILGKNRNYVKNELSKNINIFETRIFTDDPFLSGSAQKIPRLIIIAGDDRAKAIETAIYCKNSAIKTVIITENPIFHADEFAEAVITVQNTDIVPCIAALSQEKAIHGTYEYIYGTGETAISAAAQVFSKLPEHFHEMKVFTGVPANEANELFSLVSEHFEIIDDENESAAFNVFLRR